MIISQKFPCTNLVFYIYEFAKKNLLIGFRAILCQNQIAWSNIQISYRVHCQKLTPHSYKIDKKECSKYFFTPNLQVLHFVIIKPFVYLSDRLITIIPYLKIGGPVRCASPALRYFCIKQPPADAAFLWKASSVMVAEVTLISGLVFLLFCSELPLGGAWGPPLPAPLGAENWRIKPVTLFLIEGMFKHV